MFIYTSRTESNILYLFLWKQQQTNNTATLPDIAENLLWFFFFFFPQTVTTMSYTFSSMMKKSLHSTLVNTCTSISELLLSLPLL